MEKSFLETLNETYDLFKSQGIAMIGRGYEEIATNKELFAQYVDTLTEGVVSAGAKADIAQLMANTNADMLSEAFNGITPVASLAGPMIRKLWPMFALKNAVKTKVATVPALVIPYLKPYYEDKAGNKYYIHGGSAGDAYLKNATDLAGNYLEKSIAITSGVGNFVFKSATDSTLRNESIDADFTLVGAEYGDYTLSLNKKLGIERVIVADYVLAAKAAVVADETKGITAKAAVTDEKGTILVRTDLDKGVVSVAVVRTDGVATASQIKAVVVRAHYSTEMNNFVTSWGLESAREPIQIGSGEHMVAPLTTEMIKDWNALYQIDGTKEILNVMTNAFAYQVDYKILQFLHDSFVNQPGNGEFKDAGYPAATDYIAVFDVMPAPGFAGGPKMWREELKLVIDHLAARIINQTHLGNGVFNIIGNPLDIQIITNVAWSFRGGQGTVDGVNVTYSLGTYSGAYTYKVIQTEIVPEGVIYLDFLPEDDQQMTYNYWAYSFSTEVGYRDPNHPNVPAVLMTKRDVLHEFMPAIGAIKIVGNGIGSAYNPFRDFLPMETVTGADAASTGTI